jgi:hypothetical protein
MKRMLVLGLILASSAVVACNKDSGGSGGGGGGAASGDSIGIKECDAYIQKWNDCYKDPTARAAAKPAFDTMKQTWSEQAKDPNAKAALAMGCKAALDAFPSAACH